MKAAVICHSDVPGGAASDAAKMAQGLYNRGWEVDMLFLASGARRDAALDEISPNIKQFHFNGPTEAHVVLGSAPQIASYLSEHTPDVMISSYLTANLSSVMARKMVPPDVADTPLMVRQITNYNKFLKNPLIAPFFNAIYNAADVVVPICQEMRQQVVDFMGIDFNSDKVRVVYPPSIEQGIYPRSEEKTGIDWLDNRGPGGNNLQVLVNTCRLAAEKDLGTVIKAFALVHDEIPDSRLVIVGEGPERRKLEKLIGELGLEDVVALPGYSSNPHAYIGKASALVNASTFEGYCKTVAESVALGIPVVVSNCPVGPTELAAMQPESHVFPVGDVKAAAAAMKQALYDEQKRGTSKVPIPDMSEHTTNKVVNALEGIANELIAKRELAKSLPKDHGIAGWLRNRRDTEKPVSAPRHFGR